MCGPVPPGRAQVNLCRPELIQWLGLTWASHHLDANGYRSNEMERSLAGAGRFHWPGHPEPLARPPASCAPGPGVPVRIFSDKNWDHDTIMFRIS